MDNSEKEYVSKVINYFWGPAMSTPMSINEKAALIAYKALEQANLCSDSMDLVPRPKYGVIDVKYAVKQLVKIGKRIALGNTSIYGACKVMVSARYKFEIKMALQGI